MIDYIMSHSLSLALFGAYFIPFALVALAVIVWRALRLRMSWAELGLLAIFLVFVSLEFLQLSATGRSFAETAINSGVPRYFGVLAPFLWIFAARGAASLWHHPNPNLGQMGKIALVIAIGWVLLKMNLGGIIDYKTRIQAHDTEVAVERLAPKIREDYIGPRKQKAVKRSRDEYFSGLRPVVSCPFGAAGWAVRGDHCRTTGVKSPYEEDYLCFPLGSRYAGITNIDVRVYKYITSVPGGLGTHWMLFRRRRTPGRKQ